MEFKPNKCKVLIITNKIKPVQHCYKMHGIYLENVTQEKYLGVIIHRKLFWKPHVSNVVAKANSTRYFLQQNLPTCSRDVKLTNWSMSADQLDTDLKKISDWAYKWKMIFNPDLSKQAQVIFSRKTNKINHPTTTFNTITVAHTSYQKHLGLYLDEKLNFNCHINVKISKANKEIWIIKSLSHILPRKSLITIYKSFIRPHLDYCDVIYD